MGMKKIMKKICHEREKKKLKNSSVWFFFLNNLRNIDVIAIGGFVSASE